MYWRMLILGVFPAWKEVEIYSSSSLHFRYVSSTLATAFTTDIIMELSLCIFLILCITLAKSADPKLESLRAQYAIHSSEVIMLSSEAFHKFVIEGSEAYTIVVLFTSVDLRAQCFACTHVQAAFQRTAHCYSENAENNAGDKKKPVFFAIVDYTRSMKQVFEKFGFTGLPNLLVSDKSVSEEGENYKASAGRVWEIRDREYPSAEAVLGFVNRLCNRKVEFSYSFSEIFISYLAKAPYVLVAVWILWKVSQHMFNPMMWWGFGMIVYVLCMGGGVYDLVKEAHLVGQKEGVTLYLASGQKSQYILEGFFMSTLISFGGCALILINTAAKYENKWAIRVFAYISVGVLIFCAYQATNIYKEKVNWYSPSFTPPSHYKRGPLIVDQGNSF